MNYYEEDKLYLINHKDSDFETINHKEVQKINDRIKIKIQREEKQDYQPISTKHNK